MNAEPKEVIYIRLLFGSGFKTFNRIDENAIWNIADSIFGKEMQNSIPLKVLYVSYRHLDSTAQTAIMSHFIYYKLKYQNIREKYLT